MRRYITHLVVGVALGWVRLQSEAHHTDRKEAEGIPHPHLSRRVGRGWGIGGVGWGRHIGVGVGAGYIGIGVGGGVGIGGEGRVGALGCVDTCRVKGGQMAGGRAGLSAVAVAVVAVCDEF